MRRWVRISSGVFVTTLVAAGVIAYTSILGTNGLPSIYIAQSTAGADSGADCANAHSASWFNTAGNWGTGASQIGVGKVATLCGTITSKLSVQASGTAASPITLSFQAGAKISLPVCNTTPCLDLNGKTDIVVDGGTNGVIENTANGTGLANATSSVGILAIGCDRCEITNLIIQNIYQHTSLTDTAIDQTQVNAIKITGNGWSIHNTTIHDAGWAIYNTAACSQNLSVYANNIYNVDHAWVPTLPGSSCSNAGPWYFYDNHVHDYANWDTGAANAYHHDGIHCFGPVGGSQAHLSAFYIYGNQFDGDMGQNITADVFIEGGSGGGATACNDNSSNFYIFDNVFTTAGTRYTTNGYVTIPRGNLYLYNNDIIGKDNLTGQCATGPSDGTNDIRNNLIQGCNILVLGGATATNLPSASSLDYNVYGDCASFNCWWVTGTADTDNFTAWLAGTIWDDHSVNKKNLTDVGIDSNQRPTAGSNLYSVGANLTSLCTGSLTPLCADKDKSVRPSGGAWTVGAYN